MAATMPFVKSVRGSMSTAIPALIKGARDNKGRADPPLRKTIARAEESALLSGEYVFQTISELAPADAIYVEESPSYKDALQLHLPVSGDRDFFAYASGGLGYGVPAAAGLAFAKPEKRVIALIGDGAAMYSLQAIWTAAQHKLPVTYVILNNQGYGAMRAFGKILQAKNVPGIDVTGLDFASLATGMDCPSVRVDKADDFKAALTESMNAQGPYLIEVAVDPKIPELYGIED